MVSPFLQTRIVTFGRIINRPLDEILSVLHDPVALIDLNPLVIHREQSPSDPNLWIIKDRLYIMGRFKYEFTYTAKATKFEDGIGFEIFAPMGIILNNRWRTREVEGGIEVSEGVTVTANFLLMSKTLRDLRNSHDDLHDRLAAQLEGRPLDTAQEGDTTSAAQAENHVVTYVLILLMLFGSVCYYLDLLDFKLKAILVAALCAVVPFVGPEISSRDPYGTFHVTLNESEEDARAGKKPGTEWLNMGLWKGTDSFPEACEALALKLLSVAGCRVGGNVLDVGHGSGDSLLLHLRHPSVPRPSQLTGITSLKAHHARSLERVNRVQASRAFVAVTLYHGDAVYHPSADHQGGHHPLDPSSPLEPYTSILALDCAYHFRTRRDFLSQSYARLAEGGKIGLADICFSTASASSLSSGMIKHVIGLLGVMPRANMVTVEEYVHEMEDIGYKDICAEDITEDVFPEFGRFLARRGWGWSVFGRGIGLLGASGARFVIVSGRR